MAIKTYAISFMSRWQSAVLAAVRGDQDGDDPELGGPLASEHPVMMASCDACEVMEAHVSEGGNPLDFAGDVSKLDLLSTCAQLYVGLAAAKVMGDVERAREIESELQYSVCDPLWAKSLLEFDKGETQTPYRHYESIDDFVLPLEPRVDVSAPDSISAASSDSLKVAFVADWATGTRLAKNVMRRIGEQRPDVVIHLGDVYYSGTKKEMDHHFLSIVREHLPAETQVLSLAGNHDMYAGGEGYYWLLDQLGQPASYFCLRNDHWQILAVGAPPEIGNPLDSQFKLPGVDPKEAEWHHHKLDTAEGRKTVMLSHYQLFTSSGNIARSPDNHPLAVNSVLCEAFDGYMEKIDAWLWGHEHNLAVFEPYLGLKRGRCIGSGAIPVALLWTPYEPLEDLALPEGVDVGPVMMPGCRLGHDGDHYHHAFVVLELKEAVGTMGYYQVPGVDGDAELIYTEEI